MIHTNNLEQEMESGTTSLDCFKGVDLRRTELCCMVFAGQYFCGPVMCNQATYFFTQTGISSDEAYKINVGQTALGLVATLCSWFFLMPYFGRRRIYIGGMAALGVLLFIIGCLALAPASNKAAQWGQIALVLLWQAIFQGTVAQLNWAIPSELSSTRLRQKTICLARNTYYIFGIAAGVLEPYIMNPTQWNWKGKAGFFWAGTTTIITLWAYYRLAEPRHRTYEELDVLFAKKVPARQFAKYELNIFDEIEQGNV